MTVNGRTVSFTVVSDTKITATMRTGTTTGLIQITTPGGKVKSKSAFTVT